jgi:Resolvase, N terminal domain.
MLEQLTCGDEIVISKFSHAIRGSREFSVFCDYLRREKVNVISIHDEMDSSGKVFTQKSLPDFMDMLATLPTEILALRQAHEHEAKLRARKHPRTINQTKTDRNNKIVRMYNHGESIDKIWKMSGFKSRQSIFNVLEAAGVSLNRGRSKKEISDMKVKEQITKVQSHD